MARKPRDYKVEYQRRLARAQERGYSRSVARGHAPKNIAGIKLARILNVKPGSDVDSRPRQSRSELGSASFQQRLERAGFVNFIAEARKRYLERETSLGRREITKLSTSQEQFVQVVVESGHSEKEAYTAWFSPK